MRGGAVGAWVEHLVLRLLALGMVRPYHGPQKWSSYTLLQATYDMINVEPVAILAQVTLLAPFGLVWVGGKSCLTKWLSCETRSLG